MPFTYNGVTPTAINVVQDGIVTELSVLKVEDTVVWNKYPILSLTTSNIDVRGDSQSVPLTVDVSIENTNSIAVMAYVTVYDEYGDSFGSTSFSILANKSSDFKTITLTSSQPDNAYVAVYLTPYESGLAYADSSTINKYIVFD